MSFPSTRPVLCLVTDRHRLAPGADDPAATGRLLALVAAAGRAGVDLVQVRERGLSDRDLLDLVRRCVECVRGRATRVLVNDRLDVALAAGAHGVHLRSDSPDAPRIRAMVGPQFLVGRSVHGADEARQAAAAGGLDYLVLGTVFATASKSAVGEPLGVEILASAVRAVDLPVLGIGGVTLATLGALRRAGAAGGAAIGLFAEAVGPATGEPDLSNVVRAGRAAFDSSGSLV